MHFACAVDAGTNIAAINMKKSNQAYRQVVRITFICIILQINSLKFISHVHTSSKVDMNGY